MEGTCTNSHALETAHTYGIPSSIIERAQTLGRVFDKICRPDVLAAAAGFSDELESLLFAGALM